jgi:hypothetical protein
VHPATAQLSDDPQPVRVGHRREHGKQFVTGQRCSPVESLSPVIKNLHMESAAVNAIRPAG